MLSTRTRPAGAALLAACLLLSGAGRAQEQKLDPRETARKELEANLAGRSADELAAFVTQLAQDWSARKGAVEVAHQRFTAQVAEAGKARQRLDDLKPPTDPAPLVFRAADVDAAVKDAQARADHAAARAKHLGGLKDALAAVVTAGAEFDRAASAADDHLVTMRTAAALATKAGAVALPEAVGAKELDAGAARLKTLRAEVRPVFDKAKGEVAPLEAELAQANKAAEAAAAKLTGLKGAQADAVAAFKFAEQARGMKPAQLGDEFTRLRKSLAEKLGAITGDEADYKKGVANAAEARAAFEAVKDPLAGAAKEPADAGPSATAPLDEAARKLVADRHRLAARVRAMTEREEKAAALVAALDELEKKAVAYQTTLDDARRLAGQTAALGAEIEGRVGRGDLEPAKVATGVAVPARGGLDADAAGVSATLNQLRDERDALRKPDADRDNLKALTRELLVRVSERAELVVELKKLAAESATARKDRAESEQKRLDLKADERMKRDASEWDWALAFDRSQPGADASALLAAYYKELIDHDERAENLKRQNETLDSLVELTRREAADTAKLRALLEKQVAASAGAKAWDAWLGARLTPAGLKAEEGVYRDEQVRLVAVAGANARRVEALTGTALPDATKFAEQTKQPANGGEIGRARNEVQNARLRGLRTTGIKIGIILLAALLIPRVIMFVLRRAIRGGTDEAGNPSPVLAALRGVLKTGVWIAAIALVLSTLGYDVTALVVALAIGVLAVALAARPMIADVLGSVVIFAERRFKVGDVVRLGTDEPARVVGLTWRSTALKNASGLVVSVPNRTVTETTVENLSRGGETYDALAVTVSTDKDAGKVITVIRAAVAQCKNVSADNGVTVLRFTQKGAVKVVEYRFWWFLKDYEARNKTRDEVFARIALGLANEDMTGIEVSLG